MGFRAWLGFKGAECPGDKLKGLLDGRVRQKFVSYGAAAQEGEKKKERDKEEEKTNRKRYLAVFCVLFRVL